MKSVMTENTNIVQVEAKTVNAQVVDDLKHAVLIVSVVLNLFAFTTWLALQLTA